MPVLVSCSCGKKLQIADELVGRKIRCPGCKSILLASPDAMSTAPPGQLPTGINPVMVRFSCGACGKEMQASIEYGGQETACPGCNALVTIPGGQTETRTSVPALPPIPRLQPGDGMPDLPDDQTSASISARRLRVARPRRWKRWVLGSLLLLVLGGGGWAAWVWVFPWLGWRDVTPPDLALVAPDAQGFVTFRSVDAWNTKQVLGFRNSRNAEKIVSTLKDLESGMGLTMTDCERLTVVVPRDVSDPDKLRDKVYVIVLMNRAYNRDKVRDALVTKEATDASYQNRKFLTNERTKLGVYFHDERIFVVGRRDGLQACLDQIANPKTDGPLRPALREAAGKQHVVIGLNYGDLLKEVRRNLGDAGRKFDVLFEAKSATLLAEFGESPSFEMRLPFESEARASDAKNAVESLRSWLVEQLDAKKAGSKPPPEQRALQEQLTSIVNSEQVEQKKTNVTVKMKGDLSAEALSAIDLPRPGAATNEANLQRIMAAMLEYERVNAKFPPTFGPLPGPGSNPSAVFSWRVHILPYLGKDEAELYKQIRINELPTSPANAAVASRMPDVYRSYGMNGSSTVTHYQVFVGPGAPFVPYTQPRPLTKPDIRDGQARTIAVAEAANLVQWMQPQDIPFQPNALGEVAVTSLGALGQDSFTVVFFSGDVKTYRRVDVSGKKLKALITHQGNEPDNP
jgi:hypothetical protein